MRLTITAVLALVGCLAPLASAQEEPPKPPVVPVAAGGAIEIQIDAGGGFVVGVVV